MITSPAKDNDYIRVQTSDKEYINVPRKDALKSDRLAHQMSDQDKDTVYTVAMDSACFRWILHYWKTVPYVTNPPLIEGVIDPITMWTSEEQTFLKQLAKTLKDDTCEIGDAYYTLLQGVQNEGITLNPELRDDRSGASPDYARRLERLMVSYIASIMAPMTGPMAMQQVTTVDDTRTHTEAWNSFEARRHKKYVDKQAVATAAATKAKPTTTTTTTTEKKKPRKKAKRKPTAASRKRKHKVDEDDDDDEEYKDVIDLLHTDNEEDDDDIDIDDLNAATERAQDDEDDLVVYNYADFVKDLNSD